MAMESLLIVVILSLTATIVGMLGRALYWLGGKFKEINLRFREMDLKTDSGFREINARIDRLAEAFLSYQEFFIKFLARRAS